MTSATVKTTDGDGVCAVSASRTPRTIGDLLTAVIGHMDRLGVEIEAGTADATGVTVRLADGSPVRIGFGYDATCVRLWTEPDDISPVPIDGTIDGFGTASPFDGFGRPDRPAGAIAGCGIGAVIDPND